jgi:hypothetical protein
MPAFKYALPMLAAAGYAYAECSTTATATIENSSQASEIASCSTFSGNIAVATGLSDDISFGQLKEIDGDLVIKNNQNIKRIDGAGLEKISGELSLLDNSQLAAVAFPKLDNVKKLTMIGLASLRNLGFDGGISNVEDLSIENTQLQNLNGIDLNKTKSIRIIANPSIANISMGVTNMTGAMEIGDNNADVVVSFPNLEHAGNMSFRSVGNLSLPALKDVSPGSFGIFKSKLKSFYAANFTEVKSDFSISNATELEDLSLPALSKVGAFRIENTNLAEITKLGKLKEANAALDISGKNLTKSSMTRASLAPRASSSAKANSSRLPMPAATVAPPEAPRLLTTLLRPWKCKLTSVSLVFSLSCSCKENTVLGSRKMPYRRKYSYTHRLGNIQFASGLDFRLGS